MKLYKIFKQEYAASYEKHRSRASSSFAQMYELFIYVLESDKNLYSTLHPALERVAANRDSEGFKQVCLSLEPFVKQVVELTHAGGWRTLTPYLPRVGVTLSDVLQYLEIRHQSCTREAVAERNAIAHDVPKVESLTRLEYETYLEQVMQSYFLVIGIRYAALWKRRWAGYLNSVLSLYEARQAAFVDLQAREHILLIGKEVLPKNAQHIAREVAVLEMRMQIPEKVRLLLGHAGMGKTTTLLHLAHRDATQLLQANGELGTIPVYLNLAEWTMPNRTFEQAIVQKVGEPLARVERDLAKAVYVLYVDGVNEILSNVKDFLLRDLQRVIKTYPQLEMIIASRPMEFDELTLLQADAKNVVPAFRIRNMMDHLVHDFIFKNLNQTDPQKQTLWNTLQLQQYKDFLELLRTPLYLVAFLRGYERTPVIPDSNSKILGAFFAEKFRREQQLYAGFNGSSFERCLSGYVSKTWHKYGSANPFVLHEDAIAVLTLVLDELKLSLSAETIRFHALNMHLWLHAQDSQQEAGYRFAHQTYQTYFKAKADFEILKRQVWKNQ
jgi:hypothetical protein